VPNLFYTLLGGVKSYYVMCRYKPGMSREECEELVLQAVTMVRDATPLRTFDAKYSIRKLFALLLNVFSVFCKLLACPLTSVGDPNPDSDPLLRGTDPDPFFFS
jgi:hypothetical protein